MFLKKLKDDGKDVVINSTQKNILRIEDHILKAIIEDVTSPRTNLEKVKNRQAVIEALALKITSGADEPATSLQTKAAKTVRREGKKLICPSGDGKNDGHTDST